MFYFIFIVALWSIYLLYLSIFVSQFIPESKYVKWKDHMCLSCVLESESFGSSFAFAKLFHNTFKTSVVRCFNFVPLKVSL